ncbi:nicotinate-mononucleotide adenylyltransferase [Campylobacter iguaniorum]|uniref:nicotinate (nicotinamide) nucleotide adenylyltransferase n=1 Tax=Campylobacter iguaniorum TaxID=1244531 RepID=UPI0007C9579D|nr:nicotinate (nicotinamide) nucleotide adenylyltransferase [Campylobacter iguaniorum]ANE36373.1 nicotinate-mononucleotide adenylyltransferase [Campylobacter iguaniorum]
MNIAIFGGSFDPPHNAHDIIVKEALLNLKIDKLIVIPTYLNPFKSQFGASPNLRLKWCQTLWQNLPKVQISDYEIMQNRAVASIESVRHFKQIYEPKICYLIIGADQLESLEKWHKFDELKDEVCFVVASRDDIEVPSNLQKLNINVRISSTKVRDELKFDQIPSQILDEVTKFYKEKNAK